MREEPEREPWPLCPRVEVLPMPEPIPRPMRFLFSFAFLGARRLERLRIAIVSSLNAGEAAYALRRLACNFALTGVVLLRRLRGLVYVTNEMGNFCDHATDGWCV